MANDKIIACICEGSAESAIVNKLMDAGKLILQEMICWIMKYSDAEVQENLRTDT